MSRLANEVADAGATPARCADCRHRPDDRRGLERRLPGLSVFGSADAAAVGDSRWCLRHDRLVSPDDSCAAFSPAG